MEIISGVLDRQNASGASASTPAPETEAEELKRLAKEASDEAFKTPAPVIEQNPAAPLGVLSRLVDAFQKGSANSDITLQEDVEAHLYGQEKRSELVSGLVQAHEYERLVRLASAADVLEQRIIEAAKRPDLSPLEQMAFYCLFSRQRDEVSNRVRSNATDIKDLASLFMKVDITVQRTHDSVLKKFAKTTPQGREIVRRTTQALIKARQGMKTATEESAPDA